MRWRGTRWLCLLLLVQLSRAYSHDYVDVQAMSLLAGPDTCTHRTADGNEHLSRAMLQRLARERVDDYDQALRYLTQAIMCLKQLQLDKATTQRREDEREAIWLHNEYAELLRMHLLPRGSTVAIEQASEWKRDYIQTVKYLNNSSDSQTISSETRLHVFNTIGLLLLELGKAEESFEFFRQATAVDPQAIEPLGNAILALANTGDVERALNYSDQALEAAPDDPRLLRNIGLIMHKLGTDQETARQWTKAMISNRISVKKLCSLATYFEGQGDSSKAVYYLDQAKRITERLILANPSDSSAQESDNAVRLKLLTAQLPMVYESTAHIDQVRAAFESSLEELMLASRSGSLHLPKDYVTIATSPLTVYHAVYQGYNDASIRSQLAIIYRTAMPVLSYTAPHVDQSRYKRFLLQQLDEFPQPDVVILRQRIRVGFHSAFIRQDSVDKMVQGVLGRLSRDKFEVVLILEDSDIANELRGKAFASADFFLILSKDFAEAQRQVGKLELDILVFTEIEIRSRAYYLAFAQLALRTALFWDHPVTSGIDTVDYVISSMAEEEEMPEAVGSATETPASVFHTGEEDYSECVYRMQHFGSFSSAPPVLPQEFNDSEQLANFRNSLGLPSVGTMFLVRTLYKIHPAFDPVIERILDDLRDGFLVLPSGDRPLLLNQLTARWRQSLSESVYRRVFFVRTLNHSEYFALGAMADIVLDSFPVAGGRSNLDIFAVGTPIVTHSTGTTFLHLTAAMYNVMGIDRGWLAYSDNEYVRNAVRLARNLTLRHEMRQKILTNKHKLFDNDAVVSEWETFLLNIMASPPPSRLSIKETKKECPVNVTHQLSSMTRLPDHHKIEYQQQVILPVIDRLLQPQQYFLATLAFDDDPFLAAKLFCEQFVPPLDGTHHIMLGKVFWNMRNRRLQPVVQQWKLDTSEQIPIESILIEIRQGDDLDQVIRWQILDAVRRQRNYTTLMSSVLSPWVENLIIDASAQSKIAIPEHRTTQWRSTRKMMDPYINRDVVAITPETDCVALLMTTCKRLSLFLQTMAALESVLGISNPQDWTVWFCQILVVDDNSSAEDRDVMKQRFPTFEFLFKTESQRGHAQSMQLGVTSIRTRYMLYLEDDWVADSSLREACVDAAKTRHSSCFLHEALAVLQHSDDEPLAQVLLNDKHRGWEKSIDISSDRTVKVLIHELAVQDITHSYSYWPGFSFNPGIWDLTALRNRLKQSDPVLWFEIARNGWFEEYFSICVWLSGLRVASLMGERFTHTGTNGSAYLLNGLPRHWD